MAVRNPVAGGMTQRPSFAVEVAAGTAFELLSALHALTSPNRGETWAPQDVDACPPATAAAIEAVGDPTGDLWLQLIGLAYEADAPNARAFVEHVRQMRPLELRRQLLGRHVPTWSRQVGADTIEGAVRGDPSARRRLHREALSYCSDSAASFAAILPLDAAETKRRIVRALATFEEEVLRPQASTLQARLLAAADARRHVLPGAEPYELIEDATGGFRYEHESSVERVVLVPHLAGAPAILLAEQHTTYLIAYPVAAEADVADALRAIGRALDDTSRIAILARLRTGEATLTELAESVGIAKSTVHHHLVLLRAARLITIQGNSTARSYRLDPRGVEVAQRLLGSLAPA